MCFNSLLARIFVIAAISLSSPALSAGEEGPSLFDRIIDQAHTLATEPYVPPATDRIPQSLKDLDYSQYRGIRFNKAQALWSRQALFSVEFFHLGFLYLEPVVIHEVVGGGARPVLFDPAMFDYGKNQGLKNGEAYLDLPGFAGFRIHYPINTAQYQDEVIVFLGASYFRMIGRGQGYGLSARGLALNTAMPEGEEFPRFREFWLVRPEPEATTMTFYALLESESVTGAYRFELHPGTDTILDVEARLYARRDIDRLGISPLTSMFLYGSNRVRYYDDYRPQVHDSDGVLMHTGADEWIWRPLVNPVQLRVTSLLDRGMGGFGLMHRERDFNQYLDMEARYEKRPSLWVTPHGDWGKGAVQLIEIPSKDETNDNIIAFWTPEDPFKAGEERVFKYQLRATASMATPENLATVRRTRIGWGAVPGASEQPPRSVRQFIVDFQGGELIGLDPSQPVEPELSVSSGTVRDLTVQRLPEGAGWRVAFKLTPDRNKAADMRLFLRLRDRRLSETWNYVWSNDIIG